MCVSIGAPVGGRMPLNFARADGSLVVLLVVTCVVEDEQADQ